MSGSRWTHDARDAPGIPPVGDPPDHRRRARRPGPAGRHGDPYPGGGVRGAGPCHRRRDRRQAREPAAHRGVQGPWGEQPAAGDVRRRARPRRRRLLHRQPRPGRRLRGAPDRYLVHHRHARRPQPREAARRARPGCRRAAARCELRRRSRPGHRARPRLGRPARGCGERTGHHRGRRHPLPRAVPAGARPRRARRTRRGRVGRRRRRRGSPPPSPRTPRSSASSPQARPPHTTPGTPARSSSVATPPAPRASPSAAGSRSRRP